MKESKKERFIKAWKTVFDIVDVKDDDNFFEAGAVPIQGAVPIPVLAYPVFTVWPYGMGNDPENTDSNKKE